MVDDHCDEMVHKELDVMVPDAAKKWYLNLREKVVFPIKRILA